MRTTVTLDQDVDRLLRDAMHRSRTSFKATLNAAIRAGLSSRPAPSTGPAFVVKARPMSLRAGLDPTSLNKLADELEIDAIVAVSRTRKRR